MLRTEPTLRRKLIDRSIDTIWIVLTPLSAVGLLCVLVAKKYTLKRNVVKAGDKRAQSARSTPAEGMLTTTMEDNSAQELENSGEPHETGTHDPPNERE